MREINIIFLWFQQFNIHRRDDDDDDDKLPPGAFHSPFPCSLRKPPKFIVDFQSYNFSLCIPLFASLIQVEQQHCKYYLSSPSDYKTTYVQTKKSDQTTEIGFWRQPLLTALFLLFSSLFFDKLGFRCPPNCNCKFLFSCFGLTCYPQHSQRH